MSQEEEKGREEEVEVAELIEDQKAQGRDDSYFFDIMFSAISKFNCVRSTTKFPYCLAISAQFEIFQTTAL